MVRFLERHVAGVAAVLLVLGGLAAVGAAEALEVRVSFDAKAPGASVVGAGAVHPQLEIGYSDGNDVVAIEELASPAAYGATKSGILNVLNAHIATPQSVRGFADVGSGDFTPATKKHQYVFTFAAGVSVSRFSLRMLDWGDFMPNGANADGQYAMVMTAFDDDDEVVATDEIAFTSEGSQASGRISNEYGNLLQAGDASAADGQPGNAVLQVTGAGIVRVTVRPRDQQSIDPHIGFNELQFDTEVLDEDADGVADADDECPGSVTAADSPGVVIGPHATSVPNANDVAGPGCSIQDLVDSVAASARNHGQLVVGIDALAEWLVSVEAVTPAHARELHEAAAHKHAGR
jgi:hypothetical protein